MNWFYQEGDQVRVKETGEVGRVSQASRADTYWVVLPSRLFEARFRGEELEKVTDGSVQ